MSKYKNKLSPPKNQLVINPKTGTFSFGYIDEINIPHYYFPAGEILLKCGEHYGPNVGFGVRHIMYEHSEELHELGYTTPNCIARFVGDVICAGSEIYCENPAKERVTILRSKLGVVIVKQFTDAENNYYYSVITAYLSSKAHGSRIGTIKK